MTKNTNTLTKKEVAKVALYLTLILSFIAFNILMIYSLILVMQHSSNNRLLLGDSTMSLIGVILIAFLVFGSLFCKKQYDKRSGRFERDKLEDYSAYFGIASIVLSALYIPPLIAIGFGTIVQLSQNGLNNDNKMLLIGVLGTIACSLLIALYLYVFKPSPEIKDPVNTADVTQQVSSKPDLN